MVTYRKPRGLPASGRRFLPEIRGRGASARDGQIGAFAGVDHPLAAGSWPLKYRSTLPQTLSSRNVDGLAIDDRDTGKPVVTASVAVRTVGQVGVVAKRDFPRRSRAESQSLTDATCLSTSRLYMIRFLYRG